MTKNTSAVRAGVLAIIFLAFVLRIHHLAGQSLWYDEGFSVYLAQSGLGNISARTAADIQPPIYYYLLHVWMLLAGHSELAVRFLSVLFGVLTVPLLFMLTNRVLAGRSIGPLAGLLAALVLAVSPFQVWYAQETRMYTLVTMLGVLSSYLLVVAVYGLSTAKPLRLRTSHIWLLYALTNIAAVYTHYYAFFLVAFQMLFLLGWWLGNRRQRQTLTYGLVAAGVTVLAYLPWAGFALNRYAVDESYWQGSLSLDFVRKTLLAFATGQTVYETQAQVLTIGYLVLMLLGIVAVFAVRRRRSSHPSSDDMIRRTPDRDDVIRPTPTGDGVIGRTPAWWQAVLFLLLYLVVPFVLLYVLSAARPKFNPRYLMIATPPFIMLIAAGLASLFSSRRALAGLLAAAGLSYVLVTSAYALNNNYTNQVQVRDDFRSVAAVIAAERRPDEAVILSSGHLFPVYDYYDPTSPQYRIPDQETLSTRTVVTYDVAGQLNEIAGKYGGVWLVLWQNDVVDPSGILTSLLDAQAERLPVDHTFWGVELRHYRFLPGASFTPPVIANQANVNFGNLISLLGYSPQAPAGTAGETLSLTLFWQAQKLVDLDFWLALRLVDPTGHVFGRLDQRPAGYNYPATHWQPGITIPGQALLPVLAGAPPGDYTLQAGVFAPESGQSLDVLDASGTPLGARTAIGQVRIAAPAVPPAASLDLAHVLQAPAGGGIELLATDLSDRSVRQGETLLLQIAWTATQPITQDYTLVLQLVSADGAVVQQTQTPLAGTPYATSAWPAGTVVRGQYDLTIPADAPAQLRVQAVLQDKGGIPAAAPQTLTRLKVAPLARTTTTPAMQQVQQAAFGSVATLLGYDVSPHTVKPGQPIDLTLYWQAGNGAAQAPAYTVFTHLLGSDQKVWAQHDSAPADGARPTTGWVAGEVITDKHRLVVKPDAPVGDYTLEIGLYDPPTGQRLQAAESDGSCGDRILLATPLRVQP